MKDSEYAGVDGGGAVQLSAAIAGQAAGADGYVRVEADEELWTGLSKGCAAGWQDLGALWFDNGRIHMALWDMQERQRAIVSAAIRGGAYPSVGLYHSPAMRLERADHGVWPSRPAKTEKGYRFLPVEGEGLHQIPVGPVHAGIIEPGHFRFTANGETVARLEERLGYVHKGIEALCSGAAIEGARKIAARISGDSTVAYSFAFARAVEAAIGWEPPARAVLLRGIMAEMERLSHHVSDVGAICNDASVVAIHARCALIREDILHTNSACFGHRMIMDRIVPGGTACDLNQERAKAILALLDRIEANFCRVVRAYDQSPSLQNRVIGTGKVRAEFARQFAAGGFVGRAAGRGFDARRTFAYPPYDGIEFNVPARTSGDVDARVWVRIEEVRESMSIIRQFLKRLEPGLVFAPPPPFAAGEGAALIEAFRGDLFLAVRLDGDGKVAHLHARDASWFQWPLLEAAIRDNIVADFPLCNKSFNCSYSGHDM
ncbi:MAG: hydrogenase expression protein HypE [Rhodomicrobium sp.]|nr:hydrogenase expression protein HypE [Rhodomicrobium sp.]